MRNVHAFDFVTGVARAMEIATGLEDCMRLVNERKQVLDREIDLDAAHELFFRLLEGEVQHEVLDRLKTDLNAGRVVSVAQMVLAATCHDSPEQNAIVHWQTCNSHRERLRHFLVFYLDCLTGTATKPPRDLVKEVMEAIVKELEKASEAMLARWGRVMTHPPSIELVHRVLAAVEPNESLARVATLVKTVLALPETPNPQEFKVLVTELFPLEEEKVVH